MAKARALFLAWLAALALPVSAQQLLVRSQNWNNYHADFGQLHDSTHISRSEYYAAYTRPLRHGEQRFSYAHQPLLVRAGEPAHNGYLHQFDAYLRYEQINWKLEVTGGVHGSSNIFKYSRYHREALVGSFSVMHASNLPSVDYFGLSGDYRFGNFQLYPRVTSELPLPGNSHLLFDLPTALLWRHEKEWWQFGIERYGEKWGALDAERELKSAVYVQEWRIGGWYRIPLADDILIETGAGISVDTRMTYIDLETGRQTRNLGSAMFASLGFVW